MKAVVGHRDAVSQLRRGIQLDTLSHAYLITGPRAVGRRTLALELARGVNCERPRSERPCGACRACRLIGRNAHPDVRVIRRAPERKGILLRAPSGAPVRDYADNVEWIQSDAQLRPADGRRKVYLVLNAEELLPEAANRLLKSIEEPTPYTHFILTASDRAAVLPTIASRCQELRLLRVARSEIADALTARFEMDDARALELAALADGAPGWALAAAADPGLVEVRKSDARDLRDALGADRLGRLAYSRALSERWSSGPDTVRATLRAWMAWWHDLLLVQAGLADKAAYTVGGDDLGLETAANRLRPDEARGALGRVQGTLADLDANVNARLALDLLLLRLPHLSTR